ncbi:MAG: cadherin-like domain-containing protein, partial [Candidatus Kerfeldbacteria bacterium]|nr:cadherin-like domain-containing protein [Candidatus Kerfeldbacteria bacterium]
MLHLSRQLGRFIKIIEARFREARAFTKIILGIGLLVSLIFQGLLHVIVLFFYPSTTSFAHLHEMRPTGSYKASFTEHSNWLRRLKVGSTSALVVVAFLTTIVNVFFLTAQPVYAVVRTWDGGGGADTLWSNCANWSDNTCPTSSDIATFDATSTNNVTIATTLTGSTAPAGIDINTGYTGIITQNTGVSVTVGSSGYDQADGTFTGGNSAITINGAFTLSSGIFTSTSGTLTVSGNWTHTAGGTFSSSGTVAITGGDKTLDVNSTETFTNLIFNVNVASVRVIANSDTLTVTGTLTLTEGSVNQTTVPAAGTIVVQGSISHNANFDGGTAHVYLESSGTVSFSSGSMTGFKLNSADAVATGPTSGTLTFEQAVTIAAGTFNAGDGAITVASGLLFTVSGGTFNGGAGTVTMNGGVTISSGTFNAGTTTTFFCDSCTFTLSGGTFAAGSGTLSVATHWTQTDGAFSEGTSTVIFYRANGAKTIDVNSTETFYNLTFNQTTGNTKTVANSDTLNVSNTLTLTEGIITQTTIPAAGSLSVSGNVTVGTGFDGGTATLTFTGSGTQTFDLTGGEATFNGDITVNKSGGEVDLLSALTMDAANQDLTIQEGTFDLSGFGLSVTGVGVEKIIIESGGNLQLQGSETITSDSASYPQLDSGSTVTYDGTAGPYTLKDYTYSNLKINGSGAAFSPAGNEVLSGSLTVTAGTFDINDLTLAINGTTTINGGTVKTGTNTVTFGDAGADTITISSGELNIESDTPATDIVKNGTTWTNSGGTITYNAATGITVNVLAVLEPYFNLTIDSSGSIYSLAEDTDVDGTVTLTAGTLSVSGSNFGMTVGGGWTDAGTGLFTEGTGTVTFDGTGTINSNEAFENVTINSAGTLTLGAALDVDGNLTITSGTLDVSGTNYGVTVGGNWAKTGTFTQRSGTVTLDTVGTTSTISGSTTFNNLTCTTANKPLTFTAGTTQTVNGTLTLTGSADNLIVLRSSVNGSYWNLNVAGTSAVSYVDVKDSDASSGNALDGSTGGTDSGHNLNWTFNVAPTAPTTLYSNNTADTAQSGLANPGNLTDATPNFSAIYNDSDVGDIANKYCIEVNTASNFGGTNLWFSDGASCGTGSAISNITAGSRSSDKEYAGSALSCGTTYYWRIKFWDDSNAAGSFSAAANFQVNCAPTVATDSGAVNEDAVYSGDLAHVDGDSDAVTYSIVSTTSNGVTTLTNTSTGIFTYTPTADFNGSDSFTYRVNDGTVFSNTATFTITVNSVNDVPSFTKGANQTVLEDAGAQTASGWATGMSTGPSNESSQTLTFNVSNDNNSLFSTQPAVNASTGNLTYTPAANANGSATVTVNLSDNGGTANSGADTSANQTFTITVTAVNDAPSFTKGANQTVLEDAGAQTASGWATG